MLIAYRDACQSSVQAIWGPGSGRYHHGKGRPPEIDAARLHEQIERLPVPANALSAAERNRRTAEINARILDLEHQEEALVEVALDAGHDGVNRREVVSPPVVLGVRISTRARATGWPAHARKDGQAGE